MNESPSNTSRFLMLLALPWVLYLFTLPPAINYRDAPEFVNTVFTLGISHPAGFPLYNLLAKVFTFLPLGSIAFRVNLFSSLVGCLALALLFMLTVQFLTFLYGEKNRERYLLVAVPPIAYLAFCYPYWWYSLVAEVYTLHLLFTGIIISSILQWKLKSDVRYLFCAALIYGLSAGNHATVAFYLPAILILFFCWNRQGTVRNLSFCILFFLMGLSVYTYLPIRSLMEPSFDWGNPETLKGFLFQVTDRKDAHTHFSVLNQQGAAGVVPALGGIDPAIKLLDWMSKIQVTLIGFCRDLLINLSPISLAGFFVGSVLCFKKSRPLFIFFWILVGVNVTFFAGWGREAFFPSYLVASLFTAASLYYLLYGNLKTWRINDESSRVSGSLQQFDWRKIVVAVLVLIIPFSIITTIQKVDRSNDYTADSLQRKIYLDIEDRSLFVPSLSWFNYLYEQDVARLRDDVVAVPVWDLLAPDPSSMLTARRYPDLSLPDPHKYEFTSAESVANYALEFMEGNASMRPIIFEQSRIFNKQTPWVDRLQPYRHVLLRYDSDRSNGENNISGPPIFEEFANLLEGELNRPGHVSSKEWIALPQYYLMSYQMYFRDTGRWEDEWTALMLGRTFFGYFEESWDLKMIENLILQNRRGFAELMVDALIEKNPESYESWMARGLLEQSKGVSSQALTAFQKAAERNPSAFRPYLESFKILRARPDHIKAKKAWEAAQLRVTDVRQLTALRKALHNTGPDTDAGLKTE